MSNPKTAPAIAQVIRGYEDARHAVARARVALRKTLIEAGWELVSDDALAEVWVAPEYAQYARGAIATTGSLIEIPLAAMQTLYY